MAVVLAIGGILAAVGAGLLVARRSKQNKLLEIKFTQTATAKGLADLCRSVAEELGNGGGFGEITEVKGVVRCSTPLTSELAGQKCVFYSMHVAERYEETETETDTKGNRVRRTVTKSTTVASNSRRVEFQIDDGTGQITVDPTGADMDGTRVLSQYKPFTAGFSFSFGSFSTSIGQSDRKILGYELTETIFPLEQRAYVFGEATDKSGRLLIQKPSEKNKPFIITVKSEEELTRAAESTIKGLAVGAIVCFVLAAAAAVYAIVKP